jgi:hypothetical protein
MKIEKDSAGYIKKWSVVKSCPFCGGKAQIDEFQEAEPYEASYYYKGERLSCQCGISFKAYTNEYATEEIPYYDIESNYGTREKMRKDLLKRWNTRFTN